MKLGPMNCKSIVVSLGTIGNCQRPVLSIGVSQHMHKMLNEPVKV